MSFGTLDIQKTMCTHLDDASGDHDADADAREEVDLGEVVFGHVAILGHGGGDAVLQLARPGGVLVHAHHCLLEGKQSAHKDRIKTDAYFSNLF